MSLFCCFSVITLIVSLDGFRAEYLSRGVTPNLEKLGNKLSVMLS